MTQQCAWCCSGIIGGMEGGCDDGWWWWWWWWGDAYDDDDDDDDEPYGLELWSSNGILLPCPFIPQQANDEEDDDDDAAWWCIIPLCVNACCWLNDTLFSI